MRRALPLALLLACSPPSPPVAATPAATPTPTPTATATATATPTATATATNKASKPLATKLTRTVLAPVDGYSFGVAVDATHVYWVDYHDANGGLFRVPRAGGPRQKLAGPQFFARDIAVDDDAVYWSLHTDPSGAPPGKVMRMTKDRATVTVLADAQWNADRLLTSGGYVYWAVGDYPSALRRAPGSGGPVQDVVTTIQHPSMGAIELDDDAYFVAAEKSLYRIPRAGGAPVQIATTGETPSSLAVDDTHLYWIELGFAVTAPQPKCARPPCPVATVAATFPNGEIHRVPKTGGPVEIPVKAIPGLGRSLAARAGTVVFSSDRGLERWDGKGLPFVIDPRKAFFSRPVIADGELFLEQGNEIVVFR